MGNTQSLHSLTPKKDFNMVDFSKLLKAPAGEAKEPKVLVPGDYPGVIKSWEIKEAPQGKDYSSLIRFNIGLTGWAEGLDDEDMLDGDGKPLDLSKRQLRRDFYDNALFRLDEFLKSLGLELSGMTYEEALPLCVGKAVLVEVQQYMNQTTNKFGNQVGRLVSAE